MKSLVTVLFCVSCVSGGWAFAAKPTPQPPPGEACVGKGGAFPAMAYSRGVYDKRGLYQSTQIFVGNSLGTCEVMVYDTATTSYKAGSAISTSFHFDSNTGTGTLVWQQLNDGASAPAGRVVKFAQFHVVSGTVVGLPIGATTIYKFPPALNTAIDDVELSQDGTRVAFTEDHQTVSGGQWTLQLLICNVNACLVSVETAFTVTEANHGGTGELTIGVSPDSRERIYLLYRPASASCCGASDLVAVDNLGGGMWTQPVVVIDRDEQYMASIGDTDTRLDRPSALSREGQPDQVLIGSRDGFRGARRVDVYDSTGLGTLRHNLGQGYRPTWTFNPSVDEQAPNVLVGQTLLGINGPINVIDLETSVAEPPVSAQGYSPDSAY